MTEALAILIGSIVGALVAVYWIAARWLERVPPRHERREFRHAARVNRNRLNRGQPSPQ